MLNGINCGLGYAHRFLDEFLGIALESRKVEVGAYFLGLQAFLRCRLTTGLVQGN